VRVGNYVREHFTISMSYVAGSLSLPPTPYHPFALSWNVTSHHCSRAPHLVLGCNATLPFPFPSQALPRPGTQHDCPSSFREWNATRCRRSLSSLAPAPVKRTTGGMGKSWEPAPRSDYRFCQYVSPSVAHDSGPCDCMSSPSPFGPFR
jgi:hypothetical protein